MSYCPIVLNIFSNIRNILNKLSITCPSKLRDIRCIVQTIDKIYIRSSRTEDGHTLERIDVARTIYVTILDGEAALVPRFLRNSNDVQIMYTRRIGNVLDGMSEFRLCLPFRLDQFLTNTVVGQLR